MYFFSWDENCRTTLSAQICTLMKRRLACSLCMFGIRTVNYQLFLVNYSYIKDQSKLMSSDFKYATDDKYQGPQSASLQRE